MNNKNIIKPSAETLVVGARVKLRNGKTTVVLKQRDLKTSTYSIICKNGHAYTQAGEWSSGSISADDIIEVLPQKALNTVDVSTFKEGDTIKFNDGFAAEITLIEKEKDGYRKLYFMSGGAWAFKNDGTPRGFSVESTHTIIEHTPKATEDAEAQIPATNTADPTHYPSRSRSLGCIQITQHMSFSLGNVVESAWLSSLKETTAIDAIEHLKIAKWFLGNEIERLEKQ